MARILAEGHASRAADDRMYLSVNTVNTHLRHIFTRLRRADRRRVDARRAQPSRRWTYTITSSDGSPPARPAHHLRMPEVEFLRFRIDARRSGALLDARDGAVQALRTRPGFVAAYLVELEHGEWLDVTIWDGTESGMASTPHAADVPAITAYADLITEVLGEEHGLLRRRERGFI